MKLFQHALSATIVLFAMSSTVAGAQAPEVTCAKMLPAAKLQAAAGPGFQVADARMDKSGELACAWMRRGNGAFATVSVQYYDKKYIASANAKTADAFWEDLIAPIETMNKSKREPISGVDKRAVLVPAEPQRLIIIQRDDGLVRIVMNSLSKAQAIAVAKAVAAP